jgi:hypothetical protein
MNKIKLQLFLIPMLIIGICFQSTAQTITWDKANAATTDWNTASNWIGGALPGTANDVDLDGSTVVLSASTQVQRVYAGGSSNLTINASVTLTINGFSGDDGLEIQGSATVTNNGTIDISNITGSAGDGLYVKGIFINNDAVEIDGTGEYNIYVQGGNFTNNGTIELTNYGQSNTDRDGIAVDDNGGSPGTFNNDAGTITIIMTSSDDGIYVNDGSIFNNAAMITISGAGGDNGIRVDDLGTFNNNLGGTLTINATPDDQILLDNTGSLNNTGSINLNNSADVGFFVTDESVFTNGATGTVTITNAGDNGLYIDGNTTSSSPYATPDPIVNNSGMIIINGSAGFDGIRLNDDATLNNNTGGTLDINNAGDEGIQIDAGCTINNSGTVDITSSFQHGMEALGNFNNLAGSTFKARMCGLGDAGNLGDGIRMQNTAIFTNDGAIDIDGSGGEDIETETVASFVNSATATFAPGSSPGDLEIKDDFDLGASTTTFEINGTTAITDYDQIKASSSTNTFTIGANTKINLVWGFVPAVNDEFKIIDASGTLSGAIDPANVTSTHTVTALVVGNDLIVKVTALPVEMTYFKGTETEAGNLLAWETATEENNAGFEIQKSTNAKNWEAISFVEGNGTTLEVSNYEYLDMNNTSSVNYYRLKQVDLDGAFEFSSVVVIEEEGKRQAASKMYPNPVVDQLTIEGFQGTVTVFNLLGQPLRTIDVQNDVETVSLSDLENGQYLLQMTANDGTKTMNRIIKISK